MAKKKREDDLDTTTTFADMNVDGFKWYDPAMKKRVTGAKKNLTCRVKNIGQW